MQININGSELEICYIQHEYELRDLCKNILSEASTDKLLNITIIKIISNNTYDYNHDLNLENICPNLRIIYFDGLFNNINIINSCKIRQIFMDHMQVNEINIINCNKLVYMKYYDIILNKINIIDCDELIEFMDDSDNDSYDNELKSINIKNNIKINKIKFVDCKIKNITIENCPNIVQIILERNLLSMIDISSCTKLIFLNIGDNLLTDIDLSNNLCLKELICTDNKLTTIDISRCILIKNLYVENNNIGDLSDIEFPLDIKIKYLSLANNPMKFDFDELIKMFPKLIKLNICSEQINLNKNLEIIIQKNIN